MTASAQEITNSSHGTIAYIRSNGTVEDSSHRTIGHVNRDALKSAANAVDAAAALSSLAAEMDDED